MLWGDKNACLATIFLLDPTRVRVEIPFTLVILMISLFYSEPGSAFCWNLFSSFVFKTLFLSASLKQSPLSRGFHCSVCQKSLDSVRLASFNTQTECPYQRVSLLCMSMKSWPSSINKLQYSNRVSLSEGFTVLYVQKVLTQFNKQVTILKQSPLSREFHCYVCPKSLDSVQ